MINLITRIFLGLLLLTSAYVQTQAIETEDQPLTIEQKQFRTRLLITTYAAATGIYGYFAWWNKDVTRNIENDQGQFIRAETLSNRTADFHVNNEGWFGPKTPNGGADKLGHAYSSYVSTRLMTNGFRWAGYDHKAAAKLAGITTGTVMFGVEVLDGFTVEYGFSKEDLIMNLSGVGIGTLLELQPQLDDLFDIRFHYWRSDDAKKLDEYDPISDYSGQTYLLITKATGIPQLRDYKFLRYLEFAIGYGSRGYQPTPGKYEPQFPKERNLYYGISLNLAQLLNDTVFKGESSRTQKVTENVLEYLQMPGTALLFEHHF
ncbi:MAG: hypothetical protein BWK79_14920 [Beggiatoa sp. IS2]|nr:MAG: hypothetical protein BWK79_14920 [Beggiatoa sp. IS2]